MFSGILSDYTFQVVGLGTTVLGILSGVIGCFAVLGKQSLLGDTVSHSALSGVCLAFLFLGTKNTTLMLLGALLVGVFSVGLIQGVVHHSRVKHDSAQAIVMSSLFGLGFVLLTYIQKLPNANQAGLNRFIFGQASAILAKDNWFIIITGVILLLLVIVFWKELKLLTFDQEFAKTLGYPVGRLHFLLSAMIVVTVVLGLQAVGAVLMSAMIIGPAVAARQWTDKLSIMVILAGIFGGISGFAGTAASSIITKLPTGPSIVIVISTIAIISLFIAPNRGILVRYVIGRGQNKRKLKIMSKASGKKEVSL